MYSRPNKGTLPVAGALLGAIAGLSEVIFELLIALILRGVGDGTVLSYCAAEHHPDITHL